MPQPRLLQQAILSPPILWTAAYLIVWLIGMWDWCGIRRLPDWLLLPLFAASAPLSWYWLQRQPSEVRRRFAISIGMIFWLQLAVYSLDIAQLGAARALVARVGTAALFVIGLAWVVWGLEDRSRHFAHLKAKSSLGTQAAVPVWNPLDLAAWYYARGSRKLNQSVAGLIGYSLMFLLMCLILSQIGGCDVYEMPAGGGEQKPMAQVVKIQKIIRKRYVVNPYSSIRFDVPPIDEVQLQLQEITEHTYKVGYGEGQGAGFAGGTQRGEVRLIRLEYDGGDWDQDFGVGGDLNMLLKYYELTSHKVARRTESRTVAQLRSFPKGKSPPLVYLTGQRSISMSSKDIKTLREYLVDKHGMVFADNGGSRHFHNQFVSLMQRVLPEVRPAPIPLDDAIHRVPFPIPFLPYVAPHGGKDALGWWKDGRWVCYYHPGDIGDAWSDGHAGVPPEVYLACYQLGANVIFYAHSEYSKWLEANQLLP